MAYTTKARMELIFGSVNIATWADANNQQNAQHIADRIAWAIAYAEDIVNSRLRNFRHDIPFTSVPNQIEDITAMLAGVALYEIPRGMDDNPDSETQVLRAKKLADTRLNNILSGREVLDVAMVATSAPAVVNYDDDEE